jgi:hypothetical protein
MMQMENGLVAMLSRVNQIKKNAAQKIKVNINLNIEI